jgi:hypothetical protein
MQIVLSFLALGAGRWRIISSFGDDWVMSRVRVRLTS